MKTTTPQRILAWLAVCLITAVLSPTTWLVASTWQPVLQKSRARVSATPSDRQVRMLSISPLIKTKWTALSFGRELSEANKCDYSTSGWSDALTFDHQHRHETKSVSCHLQTTLCHNSDTCFFCVASAAAGQRATNWAVCCEHHTNRPQPLCSSSYGPLVSILKRNVMSWCVPLSAHPFHSYSTDKQTTLPSVIVCLADIRPMFPPQFDLFRINVHLNRL